MVWRPNYLFNVIRGPGHLPADGGLVPEPLARDRTPFLGHQTSGCWGGKLPINPSFSLPKMLHSVATQSNACGVGLGGEVGFRVTRASSQ